MPSEDQVGLVPVPLPDATTAATAEAPVPPAETAEVEAEKIEKVEAQDIIMKDESPSATEVAAGATPVEESKPEPSTAARTSSSRESDDPPVLAASPPSPMKDASSFEEEAHTSAAETTPLIAETPDAAPASAVAAGTSPREGETLFPAPTRSSPVPNSDSGVTAPLGIPLAVAPSVPSTAATVQTPVPAAAAAPTALPVPPAPPAPAGPPPDVRVRASTTCLSFNNLTSRRSCSTKH
jgi:hypothetical protein